MLPLVGYGNSQIFLCGDPSLNFPALLETKKTTKNNQVLYLLALVVCLLFFTALWLLGSEHFGCSFFSHETIHLFFLFNSMIIVCQHIFFFVIYTDPFPPCDFIRDFLLKEISQCQSAINYRSYCCYIVKFNSNIL